MNLLRCAVITANTLPLLFSLNAYAGKDPIGWSMSGNIPSITQIGQSYAINFTLVNNLPFTMPTALQVSNHSSPSNEVFMENGCAGLLLAPLQTCTVGLVLVPQTAGKKQLSVYMEYGRNKVQIPITPISTVTQSASTSQLQGYASNPFPTAIKSNTSYTLSFTFKNNGSTALTGFIVNANADNTAGFTESTRTNCNSPLPAGGPDCVISGTYNTSATSGTVQVGYTGTAGSLSANALTSTVVNNSTALGTRTFNFVNNCSQQIWFAFNGGGQNIWGCTTSTDCDNLSGTPGAFDCNPSAHNAATGQNGQCYWKNPAPADGQYALAATNGTQTVILTQHVYSPTPAQPIVWSGNIAGRTHCTSSGCETADCGGGTGACAVGVGFNQPAMQAEPTYQTNGDSYDITGINGINVPMSIQPSNASQDATNPYTCGSPGITSNQVATGGTIGGCSWSFSPPTLAYNWVADAGSTSCAANSDCNQAGGEACGLKRSSINANSASLQCGKWLGYWTADEVCGINNGYTQAPYFCNASADGGEQFYQMYACTGAVYGVSCYTNPNVSACCGCQNWQSAPSNLLIPSDNSIVQQCNGSNNTTWQNNALGTLIWYKTACPSNYVYPYDDKSSSYTCTNSATNNSVNYTITFCPGGHTGAPTGTVVS